MATPGVTNAKPLTLDQAKAAINDVLAAFEDPENLKKLNDAKAQAGDDLMKIMQIVVPVAMSIQQMVIKKYGYEPNQTGAMQFAMAIKAHDSDPEISTKAAELKAKFMPKNFPAGGAFGAPPK